MLLQHLVEESVDDTFHKDFLLTYRTFLKDPLPLIDKLMEAWRTGLPDQRERVKVKVKLSSLRCYPLSLSLCLLDCENYIELGDGAFPGL